jgi:ABC-type glycerol-3-phosphate transport system substrate-binding protein
MKAQLQTSLILALAATPAAAADLTVLTAGDQNMVDYVNDYIGPLFEKENPGIKVRVIGTGPGDAGSQKIVERFDAQAKANVDKWDADVAVVHEKFAGPMVKEGYLESYRAKIPSGEMVTTEKAKMALGANVDGYVMPMSSSQTAIAYNPSLVPNPPKSYEELVAWAKQNPNSSAITVLRGAPRVSVLSWAGSMPLATVMPTS